MKQRIVWVDALNIVACLGVLLLHCTNHQIHNFSGTPSLDWLEGLFSHSAFIWPVDVFFMLSGFTLISKQLNNNMLQGGVSSFFQRRLKRLLVPVLSWNLFYMILSEYFLLRSGQGIEPLKVMIVRFLSFDYNSLMWFFVPLTVIYLSIPFISLFVVNANRRVLKQFILLAVAFNLVGAVYSAIVPSNGGSGTLLNIYIFGSRFLMFPIAGFYFGNYDISLKTRKRLYIIAVISMVCMAVALIVKHSVRPGILEFLLSYTGAPCTLFSFAVFCWFKYIDWNQVCDKLHINSNSLAKFSGLSLGIYLIQKFWLIFIGFIGKFSFIPEQGLTCFVIMYVLCIASVWLIKKLPILKHIV